ncbi:hypothetical protein E6W39_04270 [Kitasatospora acidiphila]|uniref:Uncharacterized protein n=1 Tax=Kitasatospora acidiphila TaxID=2567942 RepID=A0A540VXW0_9ACTN|nr:hypothetical protein [Kitasatospora acidiphila]TQF01598.1 hypothetical protein E6W39_04270 [Kitasatospora acidiphila]
MRSLGTVRITRWLTVGQLVAWSAFTVGMLALYCRLVEETYAYHEGEGRFAGELALIMFFPPLLGSMLPPLFWWWALASWHHREVDARMKIRAAAVLTAAVPVLLTIAPRRLVPYWGYSVVAFALVGALALTAAWAAQTPEVAARLTEPPKKAGRRAPIPQWPAPARRD